MQYSTRQISRNGAEIPSDELHMLKRLWTEVMLKDTSVLYETPLAAYLARSRIDDWWVLEEEDNVGNTTRFVAVAICRLMYGRLPIDDPTPLLVIRDLGATSRFPAGASLTAFMQEVRRGYGAAPGPGAIFRADRRCWPDVKLLESAGFTDHQIQRDLYLPERPRREANPLPERSHSWLPYYRSSIGTMPPPEPLPVIPNKGNAIVGGSGAWYVNQGTDEESYVGTEYGGYYRHRMILEFSGAGGTADLVIQFPEAPSEDLEFRIERLDETFHETESSWKERSSGTDWTDEGGTIDTSKGYVDFTIGYDTPDLYTAPIDVSGLIDGDADFGFRIKLKSETGTKGMDFYMNNSSYPPVLT